MLEKEPSVITSDAPYTMRNTQVTKRQSKIVHEILYSIFQISFLLRI